MMIQEEFTLTPKPFLPLASGDLRNLPTELQNPGDYYCGLLRNCHSLVPHECAPGTWCAEFGVGWHYTVRTDRERDGLFADKAKMLWGFTAFRGRRSESALAKLNKEPQGTKRDSYKANHDGLVDLVEPLRGVTLLCDWKQDEVASAFDWARANIGGTVESSKELHAENPDLFLIIDREDIAMPHGWRLGWPEDPDSMSGPTYVEKFLLPAQAALRKMLTGARVVQFPTECVVLPMDAEALISDMRLPRHRDDIERVPQRYSIGKLVDNSLRNQYRLRL
jgi:hypothetical protein